MMPVVPHLPLLRLRCCRSDFVRSLLERQPAWGHAAPSHVQQHGEHAVSSYRLQAESFFLQVQWRWTGDEWQERELTVVPGAVVALRLVLDDVSPARVTSLLDLPPTRAFAKGESGPHRRSVRDEGLWIHEVMPQGFHWAEEKIAELVGLLRARSGWRDVLSLPGITWAGVTVHLRGCSERMGGLVLEARLLEDLVGLSLQLDVALVAE
jgi:hypothetical protein